LMILPDSTDVYPGHGAFTTIGAETWLKDVIGKTEPEKVS
jgi:hypothetical protein